MKEQQNEALFGTVISHIAQDDTGLMKIGSIMSAIQLTELAVQTVEMGTRMTGEEKKRTVVDLVTRISTLVGIDSQVQEWMNQNLDGLVDDLVGFANSSVKVFKRVRRFCKK